MDPLALPPNLIYQGWAEGLFTAQKCNRTGTNRTDSCANPEASSGRRTRRDLLANPDDSWFWNSWLFQGQRFFSGRRPGIDVHNHAPDQIHHDHQHDYWAEDCTRWVTSSRRDDDGGQLLDCFKRDGTQRCALKTRFQRHLSARQHHDHPPHHQEIRQQTDSQTSSEDNPAHAWEVV